MTTQNPNSTQQKAERGEFNYYVGTLLEAKIAKFKDDDGVLVNYGKVQLLLPDASGDFHKLQNLKVKKENFGLIADLSEKKMSVVRVSYSINTYKNNTNYYLESVH